MPIPRALETEGFVVIPGPCRDIALLPAAYDTFVAAADPASVKTGSTSIRVSGLVNGGPAFDPIYVHPPLLAAAQAVIAAPFKLSAFHARTLRPGVAAEALHQDFAPVAGGWPMVGFILMIDAFTEDNGATRFLPGSQGRPEVGAEPLGLYQACGPAGSMVLYNGSVWHGHGANLTGLPRRSIQGALIRRDQQSSVDHAALTLPQTRARLSDVALKLLGNAP